MGNSTNNWKNILETVKTYILSFIRIIIPKFINIDLFNTIQSHFLT